MRILKRLFSGTREDQTFYTSSHPMIATAPGSDLPPTAASELDWSLRRPATANDSLPRASAESVNNVVKLMNDAFPSRAQPGSALISQSRRVLSISGEFERDVYLVPTTNGWVCSTSTDNARQTNCVRNLVEGVYCFSTQHDLSGSLFVQGLVSEQVREVTIDVDGKDWDAALGGGAFFAGIEDVASESKIEIHFILEDGQIITTQSLTAG